MYTFMLSLFSRVRFCATLWTVARQLCPWDSPGKNTGVGCYFLLQGISLTQGLNLHLLPWQPGSLPLAPPVYFKYYTCELDDFVV